MRSFDSQVLDDTIFATFCSTIAVVISKLRQHYFCKAHKSLKHNNASLEFPRIRLFTSCFISFPPAEFAWFLSFLNVTTRSSSLSRFAIKLRCLPSPWIRAWGQILRLSSNLNDNALSRYLSYERYLGEEVNRKLWNWILHVSQSSGVLSNSHTRRKGLVQ